MWRVRDRIERPTARVGTSLAALVHADPLSVWHSALVTIQATYFQRVVSVPVDLPRIVLVVDDGNDPTSTAYQAAALPLS